MADEGEKEGDVEVVVVAFSLVEPQKGVADERVEVSLPLLARGVVEDFGKERRCDAFLRLIGQRGVGM